jgi:hypothetical protein
MSLAQRIARLEGQRVRSARPTILDVLSGAASPDDLDPTRRAELEDLLVSIQVPPPDTIEEEIRQAGRPVCGLRELPGDGRPTMNGERVVAEPRREQGLLAGLTAEQIEAELRRRSQRGPMPRHRNEPGP